MGISFGVTEMKLSGTLVQPPANGMTVFIGPNNSGKSLLLRELAAAVTSHPGKTLSQRVTDLRLRQRGGKVPDRARAPLSQWIADLRIHADGSAQDFLSWLQEHGQSPQAHPQQRELIYPAPGQNISQQNIIAAWEQKAFSQIAPFLIQHLQTVDRINNHTDTGWWDPDFPPPSPVQYLADDRDAQKKFSTLVETAFGQPIAINRYDYSRLRLQVGDPGLPEEIPPGSPELRTAYQQLPVVSEQGDGFRAFVNIILNILVRPAPMVVIDEPEAFLHPPQARLLGRYLAQHTPSPCQVFVATHSSDFLAGVLEATPAKPVSLVRLSRTGGTAKAHPLKAEAVSTILRTPLLRYSNIISGLFHDKVVLCESEGDCQFYAATFDVVRGNNPHDNTVFLHVNGKPRLADAAAKLRQCGIPVAAIADLDLLDNSGTVKNAINLLGGRMEDIQADLDLLTEHTRSSTTFTSAQTIKKRINDIIGSPKAGTPLDTHQVQSISSLLKPSNGWKQLKKAGIGILAGDKAHQAATDLVDYFADRGLFLVPVGELESWVPQVPNGNKARWLTQVFDQEHHLAPTPDLTQFCSRITKWLTVNP
jgi:hypothetical protein